MQDAGTRIKNLDKQLAPLTTEATDALGDTRQLVNNLNEKVVPITDDIAATLQSASAALDQVNASSATISQLLEEDSEFRYNLRQTLLELSSAGRSLRVLADNFSRVLTENLTLLLNTDYVYPFPWKNRTAVDYQVNINVYRFDATPGQKAELTANWAVYSGEDQSLLFKKKSTIHKVLNSEIPSNMVAALNEILTDFSHEIAVKIQSLVKGH